MLRIRLALEHASKRRWIGLLLLLLVAVLLVLLVLHALDHALADGTQLLCFAVALFGAARIIAQKPAQRRQRVGPLRRGPPRPLLAAAVAAGPFISARSSPLRQ